MQLTTKGRYAVTAMLDLASNDTGKAHYAGYYFTKTKHLFVLFRATVC